MKTADLSNLRVIAARDVEQAGKTGVTELLIAEGAVITPSAKDLLGRFNVRRTGANGNGAGAAAHGASAAANGTSGQVVAINEKMRALYYSPQAEAIKQEICAVGRKLWLRHYVDGNGGNISYRIGENEVLCTPTLISKYDLTPGDICMVDLEGNQLVGSRPRTSEILLHLEIYKSNPAAKAVVHCHPPHATAYAITGHVPPPSIIPEFDVFVGSVAVSPYETPGTKKFAETVVPYVRAHNTVLLANHGIVCWADTVTHAEWYVEVVETYCNTLLIASQLGVPITRIAPDKANDLLEIKRKLGLPDARFHMQECNLSDMPDLAGKIAMPAPGPCSFNAAGNGSAGTIDAKQLEDIIAAVTDTVLAALQRK